MLIGALLGIGLMLGIGLGGDPRLLAQVRIRLWWLAPIALVLQVAPIPEVEGELGALLPFAALFVSFLLLLVVVVMNFRTRGFGVMTLGLILNLMVIALNQGMPVSGQALSEIGAEDDIPVLAEAERGAKHHLATEEDLVRPLGDVIAVREPFEVVVSPGDLLLYGGAGFFLAAATLGRARRDPEPPPLQARPSTSY